MCALDKHMYREQNGLFLVSMNIARFIYLLAVTSDVILSIPMFTHICVEKVKYIPFVSLKMSCLVF